MLKAIVLVSLFMSSFSLYFYYCIFLSLALKGHRIAVNLMTALFRQIIFYWINSNYYWFLFVWCWFAFLLDNWCSSCSSIKMQPFYNFSQVVFFLWVVSFFLRQCLFMTFSFEQRTISNIAAIDCELSIIFSDCLFIHDEYFNGSDSKLQNKFSWTIVAVIIWNLLFKKYIKWNVSWICR